MPEAPAIQKPSMWPKNRATYYIETLAITFLVIVSMSLQYGKFDFSLLLSTQTGVRILGSLSIWFANRLILDYLLQSRINANKVTQFLPFELTIASIIATSIVYAIFYPIVKYLEDLDFVFASFLQGFMVTVGFSLFVAMVYIGSQVWKSWWTDGEFFFQVNDQTRNQDEMVETISIQNSRGTFNLNLNQIHYFISESKIVFLVDDSGKKWITQYSLSELEDQLGGRFFRLNRGILVSRQVITQIKKLPNHRLLVSIGEPDDGHSQTISRYKSTRFKQWFDDKQETV